MEETVRASKLKYHGSHTFEFPIVRINSPAVRHDLDMRLWLRGRIRQSNCPSTGANLSPVWFGSIP